VVPILIGLGITDLDAIRVAALANNAPVSYGALGAPILGLAAVTGLPLMALSASIGNIVAILALLPPWILIYFVTDWEGVKEAWPIAIVGSLSYIAGQWPVAHYLGPYLPDLSGALASFWIMFLFVKIWRPKTIRGFGGTVLGQRTQAGSDRAAVISGYDAFVSWTPYLVLIVVVVAWTGPWSHLPAISLRIQFCPFRSWHLNPGVLSGYLGVTSADPQRLEACLQTDVPPNVGSVVGGLLHFWFGICFCLHRYGKFPRLRAFKDWSVFRSPGSDPWLDRCRIVRQ
jgi:L-lactate permease